ncbi:MAG: exodeoxyribonuclease VII large subunit [Nitrospinota bacterium]|nr:MAG: exodeoxyribonuclease VII large subunit [Nitrospinota bacterium]
MENLLLPFPQRKIYTVSELTQQIREVLEEAFFQIILVEGEISNLRTPSSGHSYLTLKDENSQLRAVIFKPQRLYLRFQPEDGMQVIARGRLTVYEPRGEYQLVIESLEPKGIGALQIAFEQLKTRLAEEGLFDQSRKRPLPAFPQKIGIITSPTGAAIRDMLQIIRRRFANVHILLYPVRVQGEGAAEEIAQGIEVFNTLYPCDVLIVGRGGGSLEDLWAFNEERVARAIFHSRIPVISAVGHEIDYTIADFVADLRAPTPSAAAELVVKNKAEILQRIETLQQRLFHAMQGKLALLRRRLSHCTERRVLTDPLNRVYTLQQRLDELTMRMERSMQRQLEQREGRFLTLERRLYLANPRARYRQQQERLLRLQEQMVQGMRHRLHLLRQRLHGVIGKLDALSPLAILGRGYSICRHLPSQEVIKSVTQLQAGDRIQVMLADGELRCGVEKVVEKEI